MFRRVGVSILGALAIAACGVHEPERPLPPVGAQRAQRAEEAYGRGRAAMARGDGVRAEQYFSLAIREGYDRSRVVPLIIQVCLQGLHLRTAWNYADLYLRDHPEDDALRYLVASIDLALGEETEARSELERLLRRQPSHADAHFLLGTLMGGDSWTAKSHLESYLSLAPHGRYAAEAKSRLAEIAVGGETSP